MEFAEHREYVPGDDTRHMDWKLFAKTEKFYLKRYEQETNLICNLVLDTSESMKYGSETAHGGLTKLQYGGMLAACMAYLVVRQQDSVGLTLFEDRIRYQLPPSGQPRQLKQILHLIGVCQPANLKSDLGAVLGELAGRLAKRSLVVLISDCFDDIDRIVSGLSHLRYKRHEVALFHLLDPAEIDFPFKDITMFQGLESLPEILAEPRSLRKAYRREFEAYRKKLLVACRGADVDYRLVRTDVPLDQMLSTWLATRAKRAG